MATITATNFQEQTFCLTGRMQAGRKTLEAMIEARDAQTSPRINRYVTVCVYGEDPGSKYDEARRRGILTMRDDEFYELLRTTPLPQGSEDPYDAWKITGVRPQRKDPPAACPAVSVEEPLDFTAYRVTQIYEPFTPPAESPAASPSEPTKVVSMPKREGWTWGKAFTLLGGLFVIVSKLTIILAALGVCVALWLIGIPATPPKI